MSKKILGGFLMFCGAISMFFTVIFIFACNDIGWFGWFFIPIPIFLEYCGVKLVNN
jgi:hypothetical protein